MTLSGHDFKPFQYWRKSDFEQAASEAGSTCRQLHAGANRYSQPRIERLNDGVQEVVQFFFVSRLRAAWNRSTECLKRAKLQGEAGTAPGDRELKTSIASYAAGIGCADGPAALWHPKEKARVKEAHMSFDRTGVSTQLSPENFDFLVKQRRLFRPYDVSLASLVNLCVRVVRQLHERGDLSLEPLQLQAQLTVDLGKFFEAKQRRRATAKKAARRGKKRSRRA